MVTYPKRDFRWASIPQTWRLSVRFNFTLVAQGFLSWGTQKSRGLGDLEKEQVVIEGKGGCFKFLEHPVDKGYSFRFLSFVPHRMVSPHPKKQTKRVRREGICYMGEGSESDFQHYQNKQNKQTKDDISLSTAHGSTALGGY